MPNLPPKIINDQPRYRTNRRAPSWEKPGSKPSGSIWQCLGWSWQCNRPNNQRMTSESISVDATSADGRRRQPIVADLAFWSVAGAAVAALSGPLGQWWDVPRTALLAGGLSFPALGIGLLYGLRRARPIPRAVVQSFAVVNLALAPVMWVAALLHVLPVSAGGNWALAAAGDIMLVLGLWQWWAARHA